MRLKAFEKVELPHRSRYLHDSKQPQKQIFYYLATSCAEHEGEYIVPWFPTFL